MKIFIDNGHGRDTAGKRSPEGECLVPGSREGNAICVSIHFSAYGNGSVWTSPSGWSINTSVGNTAADSLADCIAKAAAMHLPSMKLRGEWSDGDID